MASNRTIARMYNQGALQSEFGGTAGGKESRTVTAGHGGAFIAMHNTALPPVAEFDAFVSLQLAKTRGKQSKMTGAKLKRVSMMRRNGCTLKECGRAIGVSLTCVKDWCNRLPAALGGV